MITVIAGTNRNNSYTKAVADICCNYMNSQNIENQLLDLSTLPTNIFHGNIYWNTPKEFEPFQEKILNCDGILTVLPEYNGSFPGALKFFIDLLKFPESLHEKPSAFVGVAAGYFGALRAIEQLEMVFQYREAHIFGKRVMFPKVQDKMTEDKLNITDNKLKSKLEKMLIEFNHFSHYHKSLTN
ncbi:MAG: NAD(P)H-dependent oxidoreductase [Halobacteriovoraceae bacterium]|nr:NAD(P)H-dependent oxidoreductase [Halobacteriovoraceae bacterium]MCB9095719.1 NAD(P)H-dependent oxidoreductase [Halobacteriovoraceae bacterium]